jgi:cell division septation protein DedD
MLKYVALLFNTIALVIYQFFFAEGITVTQNIPSSVKPDSEFTIELTINKGSIGGFAKLQQDLPEGFTAFQDENNGASFSFTNQSVKFIWMSLPSDKEFKIKYKVKVAAGINGDKVIAGKFSYVSDNIKQSIEIAASTITVGSKTEPQVITPVTTTSETGSPETTTNVISSSEPTTLSTEPIASSTSATSSEPSSIVSTRTMPNNVTDNFTVEILVNKGNVTGFAKLLETLPAGFTATAGELQGASFSFDNQTQKVKFVWVSMPSQTEFRISYKVTVPSGVIGNKSINGIFSYIENDETKKYNIPTSSFNVETGSGTVATTTSPTTTNSSSTAVASTIPASTSTNQTSTTTPVNTTQTMTTVSSSKSLSPASTIPAVQSNVNYRIQIAALHKAADANTLAARYNINDKVNTEMAEGFTKYTVGSHNDYKTARDSREEIRNKGIIDAFVTAYSSGKRITVQEAIMITSQKWYR